MPSDNLKLISNKETKREDYNLPKDAFVLCCFNKTYKISSSEFDIWMRILKNVNKSVLWLLKSNDIAMENLRIESKKRGVNPDRIIFADKIPIAEHLNRHKHADLFVDTFNYNAHVTTNDSLWAGLPVVTKEGSQFSARVSSSLLYSIGLEELVAKTNEDYERIITELAFDPNKLLLIKEKLFNHQSVIGTWNLIEDGTVIEIINMSDHIQTIGRPSGGTAVFYLTNTGTQNASQEPEIGLGQRALILPKPSDNLHFITILSV